MNESIPLSERKNHQNKMLRLWFHSKLNFDVTSKNTDTLIHSKSMRWLGLHRISLPLSEIELLTGTWMFDKAAETGA